MPRRDLQSRFLISVCALTLALGGLSVRADPAADYERGVQSFNAGDLVTAMQFLERAAEAGHPGAQFRYGYILDQAEDNATALRYYRLAAEAGNADAAYALGSMYASGDGTARDYVQARAWFEKAADQGHNGALETLGIAHLEGGLGMEKNSELGRQLLQRAANNGYAPARRQLQRASEAGTE